MELRDDLSGLGRVMAILGPCWRGLHSDALKDAGGNRERIQGQGDRHQPRARPELDQILRESKAKARKA
jgi:hypothetical protein